MVFALSSDQSQKKPQMRLGIKNSWKYEKDLTLILNKK